MRWRILSAVLAATWLTVSLVLAAPRKHTVASGQTIGAIAHRYSISIQDLCAANGITRRTVIRPGKELIIPEPGKKAPRATGPRTHTVGKGDTLGGIAHQYEVPVDSLCRANGLDRTSPIRTGQRLAIPIPGVEPAAPPSPPPAPPPSSEKALSTTPGGLQELTVSGSSPVYYYEPTGPGRLGLKPVIFYLHGRGGDPASDCRRWAPIARPLGWLVCPSGPTLHNGGRAWHNSWVSGQNIVFSALKALRSQFGRRVQLYGNTLVGFSEGAHVAMNVGVRNPRTFNRWLILGASDMYWGIQGVQALQQNRGTIRRVYLITGGRDGVVERTRVVKEWLQRARVATRISTPDSLAHEIALGSKAGLYRMALIWLDRGG
jgi:LysM repeat protein/predicted esterase